MAVFSDSTAEHFGSAIEKVAVFHVLTRTKDCVMDLFFPVVLCLCHDSEPFIFLSAFEFLT
jgi:hypothetical protein